jgi:transposase-like protein
MERVSHLAPDAVERLRFKRRRLDVILSKDPEVDVEMLAERLALDAATVYRWVQDHRRRARRGRPLRQQQRRLCPTL